jgi:hypothetical protein
MALPCTRGDSLAAAVLLMFEPRCHGRRSSRRLFAAAWNQRLFCWEESAV